MRRMITLFTMTLSIISLSSAQTVTQTENYYGLKALREAGPPRQVKMVKVGNMNRGRSVVSEGILFTYKSRSARAVGIAGNFSQWRAMPMDRGDNGVWFFLLDDKEGNDMVRYKFCVDGIWTYDPVNPGRIDDSTGSFLSITEPYVRTEGRNISYRMSAGKGVEFRIYRPRARVVSLVGDFNHWNPENDLLRKGSDGIWRITKQLQSGWYRYRYLIDGIPSPDLYNPNSGSDDAGDICSMITVR